MTPDDFQQAFAVNSVGPALGIQALAPLMGDGGSIVNVGSAAGVMAHYGIAYGASKWALRGITKTAAMELGPTGIRVNLVSPGFIDTPMTRSAPDAFRAANLDATPLGRTGGPAEVAAVIVHLLSPDAAYVTGYRDRRRRRPHRPRRWPADRAIDGLGASTRLMESINDRPFTDTCATRLTGCRAPHRSAREMENHP